MADRPLNNKEFAAQDSKFIAACEEASIKATSRQASKYRNGFGKAFKAKRADN